MAGGADGPGCCWGVCRTARMVCAARTRSSSWARRAVHDNGVDLGGTGDRNARHESRMTDKDAREDRALISAFRHTLIEGAGAEHAAATGWTMPVWRATRTASGADGEAVGEAVAWSGTDAPPPGGPIRLATIRQRRQNSTTTQQCSFATNASMTGGAGADTKTTMVDKRDDEKPEQQARFISATPAVYVQVDWGGDALHTKNKRREALNDVAARGSTVVA
eukprot:SAG22_NODE_1711_length_3758_cov_3.866630_2_plen_221_part_00